MIRNGLFAIAFFASMLLSGRSGALDENSEVTCIGCYNLKNLFDTIDGSNQDEEFLPSGANHYDSSVFNDKLQKLADVISLIGTDETPDGLAVMGCAEIENATVLAALA